MFGHSGKVRFRTLTRASAVDAVRASSRRSAKARSGHPGVYPVAANGTKTPFTFIVLRPFGEKRGEVAAGLSPRSVAVRAMDDGAEVLEP